MKRDVPSDVQLDSRSWVRPLSGQKARRFRARWAGSAIQAGPTTRTIKFPLETGQRLDPLAFAELDSTLRDLRPGTLPWLLMTAHAAGFRIFAKADEVVAFLNADRFDNRSYREALRNCTGITCNTLDPLHLYLRFRKIPRPKGGLTLPFDRQTIASEYIRHFTDELKEGPDPTTVLLLSRLAGELERLGGWRQLAADPRVGFEAWDEVMRLEGLPVSPLAPRFKEFVYPQKLLAKATIAFDPAKQKVPFDDDATLPLLVSVAFAEARGEGLNEQAALSQRVLQLLLTDNYSGLSWLWGAGLRLLKGATVKQCATWFGADEASAAALTSAAKRVPPDRVFGDDGYAAYRADVGGMLASWIGRYMTRLQEIEHALERHAPARPEAARLELGKQALDRLLGKRPAASGRDPDDLEHSCGLLAAPCGEGAPIPGEMGATADVLGNHHAGQREAAAHSFRTLPKPPRVDPLEPMTQCRAIASEFTALLNVMPEQAKCLLEWCENAAIPDIPFERMAEEHLGSATSSNHRSELSRHTRLMTAVSAVLDRLGKVARRGSGLVARRMMSLYSQMDVFDCPEHLHRYFLSRQGALCRRSRGGDVLPIADTIVANRGMILPAIDDLIRSIQAEILARPFEASEFVALFDLERVYCQTILHGTPECLPVAAVRPPSRIGPHLPISLRRQFQTAFVSRDALAEWLDLCATRLHAGAFALGRHQFVFQHAFTRARDNALLYVPKNVDWKPPARLYTSSRPIGTALSSLYRDGETISPPELLSRVVAAPIPGTGAQELLIQSPHSWFYAGAFGGTAATGLSTSKAALGKRVTRHESAFRLIGSRAAKNWLDQSMLGRKLAIGDLQLICERHFAQRAEWDGATMQVNVRELDCSLTLGVPFHGHVDESEMPISMDRYLCVEFGEHGVGWAAFDTRTHKELANGLLPVASLRSWLRRSHTRLERERPSSPHQGRDGKDNAREQVVIHAVHAIDSLLSKFRAFPVLKMKSPELAGHSEIERVHEMVVEAYAFVDQARVIRRRRARWSGAQTWVHPYLWRENPANGKIKPLHLFPGTVVSARGINQECSRCGRNALETVAMVLNENNSVGFLVRDGGKVELPNGIVVLYRHRRSTAAQGRFEQATASAPQITTYDEGPIPGQRLITALQETIRSRPPSYQRPATKKATYLCPYLDCAACEDAEINVVRNIARRFRERLVQEMPQQSRYAFPAHLPADMDRQMSRSLPEGG